jgi:hypothetical protein
MEDEVRRESVRKILEIESNVRLLELQHRFVRDRAHDNFPIVDLVCLLARLYDHSTVVNEFFLFLFVARHALNMHILVIKTVIHDSVLGIACLKEVFSILFFVSVYISIVSVGDHDDFFFFAIASGCQVFFTVADSLPSSCSMAQPLFTVVVLLVVPLGWLVVVFAAVLGAFLQRLVVASTAALGAFLR